MRILTYYTNIINAGVSGDQSHSLSDKIQARNKLSLLCVIFSFIYFFYFLIHGQYIPFTAITVGIIFFITSIVLNHFRQFTISSLLILFNTNYCVLFFSIYLGFYSGIHLYLFTSPLIVLSLFDTKKALLISLSMISYILNFAVLISLEKLAKIDFHVLNHNQKDNFYLINFICCSVILITLSLYFLYNNNRINTLLILKNKQLLYQQEQLKEENEIRKIAEAQAVSSLIERDILLSETHHRVKNNLAVVTALLELQSFYITDKETTGILRESQNRIKSIALLHEKLYENKSLKNVNVSLYAAELIHFIKQSLSNREKDISIHSQMEPINLLMAKAMPFGLLLNELITNSYKYAFLEKEKGNIWLNFNRLNDNYILEYKDDGPGFEYNDETKKNSLGLNLIESFCIQLNGKFEYKYIGDYLTFELNFPVV
ncbi:MAG: sensor histidine kinase [Burkholderiales bacterium]|nr:sensor histidine kinase [Bacteroidia bacterium]